MATARRAPLSVALAARRNNLASPRTIPRLNPKMAAMSGATSMAPMMTAGLFCRRPNVAMAADSDIMTKKSTLGSAPSLMAL